MAYGRNFSAGPAAPENTHDLGDLVYVYAEFRETQIDPDTGEAEGGDLMDPAVVKLSFKDPSDNTTTWQYGVDVQVVKDSTGKYHAHINADEAGTWGYRWWSTGDGQAAEIKHFEVEEGL